jgi:WD40 repeat protein
MSKEWYYAQDNRKQGPVTIEKVRALAKAGDLAPIDPVWTEGMTDWKKMCSVKGLIPPSQIAPPPVRGSTSVKPSMPVTADIEDAIGGSPHRHPWLSTSITPDSVTKQEVGFFRYLADYYAATHGLGDRLLAFVLGLIATAVLSLLKPTLGYGGIVLAVVVVAGLTVVVVFWFLFRRIAGYYLAHEHLVPDDAHSWSSVIAFGGMTALLPLCLLVAIEYFSPQRGVLASQVPRLKDEQRRWLASTAPATASQPVASDAISSKSAPEGDGPTPIEIGPLRKVVEAAATVRVINRPVALMKSQFSVGRLAFSPNGMLLRVNDELWNVLEQKWLTQENNETQIGGGISFAPDARHMACVMYGSDGQRQSDELRLFRINQGRVHLTGKLRIRTQRQDRFRWSTSLWSHKSNYVAVISGEVLIVATDPLGNPQERLIVHPSLLQGDVNGLGRLVGPGFACHISAVAFSPDEKTIAVAFNNKGVFVFGLPDCRLLATLPFDGSDGGQWEWAMGSSRSTLDYTSDGKLLVTKQRHDRKQLDGRGRLSSFSLMVWDTSTFSLMRTVEDSETSGELVVSGFTGLQPGSSLGFVYPYQKSPSFCLWNAITGQLDEVIRPSLIPHRTTRIASSSDGNTVLFDQVEGSIQVWDIRARSPVVHIEDELAHSHRASAISADGRLIATGYPNGEVALWNVDSPGRVVALQELRSRGVRTGEEMDRENERTKNEPPFRSRDVTVQQFVTKVGRSGEVMNPRNGLPVRLANEYELRRVLGEPTNVISSRHEFGRGTEKILDYACSDGRVQLSVTYDLAGAWINNVLPLKSR